MSTVLLKCSTYGEGTGKFMSSTVKIVLMDDNNGGTSGRGMAQSTIVWFYLGMKIESQ